MIHTSNEKGSTTNIKNRYKHLAPVLLSDEEGKTYIEALHWALQQKDIKNIALTGNYGSGKSSIIKTFEDKYPNHKCLNISLATFNENEIPKELKGQEKIEYQKNFNDKIELSILQQILYSETDKKLPYSRFRRISNMSSEELISFTMKWSFIIITLLLLLFKEKIKTFDFVREIKNEVVPSLEIILLLLTVVSIALIIYEFKKIIPIFKVTKINTKAEIELSREPNDSSILNKNIDELIYFFERTAYRIVIIEDLDRFKEPEIFTRLREINLLLNKSSSIENKPITFIYALKDNIFVKENRTKFFDFIIPVIPVLHTANSFEKLKERLKNEAIDNSLIREIAFYIHDMRLLNNICNEYFIYKERLIQDNTKLSTTKLFAILVYKNMCPDDFSELLENKGLIYTFFYTTIPKVKKVLRESIHNDVVEVMGKISKIENIRIKDIEHLRRIYISKWIEKIPNTQPHIYINNTLISPNQITKLIEDSVFNEIMSTNQFSNNNSYYAEEFTINFSEIEKEIDPEENYTTKENLIYENKEKRVKELENKYNELVKINSLKTIELFAQYNTNVIEEIDTRLKEKDVLLRLMRRGDLAEDYIDYIAYFYAGDITRNDREFILSVRNRKALDINYSLNKPENVWQEIKEETQYEEILNIDLINYLLSSISNYNDDIFYLLANESLRQHEFIESYCKKGKYLEKFINAVVNKYDDLLEFIYNNSNIESVIKDIIMEIVLKNSTISTIQSQSNTFIDYIESNENFLTLINNNYKEILPKLEPLGVKFNVELKAVESYSYIFNYIPKNNLYKLNEKMINFIISNIDSSILLHDLEERHYSTIQNSNCTELKNYIKNNLKEYIDNVFLSIDTNTQEDEKYIIELLNNEELKVFHEKIIRKQAISIQNSSSIKDLSTQKLLLSNNKLLATWDNLYTIFMANSEEIPSEMIEYLNNIDNATSLSQQEFSDKKNDSKEYIYGVFDEYIINSEELNLDCYNLLIDMLPFSYDKEINFEKLSIDKLETLLDKDKITLTADDYKALKTKNDTLHIELLENNIKDYNNKIQVELDFDIMDNILLLKSKKLTQVEKIIFAKEYFGQYKEGDNSKEDKEISELIANLYLSLNPKFNTIDINNLVILFKNISTIKIQIQLFNKYFKSFEEDNEYIAELIDNIGNENFEKLNEKGPFVHTELDNEEDTKIMLEKLKSIEYISSYKEEKDKLKVNMKKK